MLYSVAKEVRHETISSYTLTDCDAAGHAILKKILIKNEEGEHESCTSSMDT